MILAALFLSLGTRMVPAHSNQSVLWKVGGSRHHLGLSPSGYLQFKSGGFYMDGISDSTSIPYVLPGPADSWAGSKPHTDRFVFGLAHPKDQENYLLDLKFKDGQDAIPPVIGVSVNGKRITTIQIPSGGGDQSLNGDFSKAHPFEKLIGLPGSVFTPGNNTIELNSVSGSWVILKSITFWGPSDEKAKLLPGIVVGPVTSPQYVFNTSQGPRQPLEVQFKNIGPSLNATLNLEVAGQKMEPQMAVITPGISSVQLLIPWQHKNSNAVLRCQTTHSVLVMNFRVHKVGRWTIALFPHAHLDVGYTNTQAQVSQIHRRNLLLAMKLRKEYQDNPTGSRYHYNFEGTWVLQQALSLDTPAQIAEIKKGLQSGILECSAAEANELTGLMNDEEMMASYRLGILTGQNFGVHFGVATQTDVPGVTWGDVTALHAAGIKALILMPNPSDRLGDVNRVWRDKPFWWQSEDGKDKILVWQTVTYGMAHGIRPWDGERDHIFTTKTPTKRFIGSYILPRLQQLAAQNYPYRLIGIPWSDTDNSPVDGDVPIAAEAWNKKYASPKVEVTTWQRAVKKMIAEYGKKLPIVRGDYTPYWEDGAGSTAKQTAMNRASANRLMEAEAVFAMRKSHHFPANHFMQAWQNIVLFSEHTWGAYNSISDPNSPFVKELWRVKKQFAVQGSLQSQKMLDLALQGYTEQASHLHQVVILNPTGWKRSGVVTLPASLSRGMRSAKLLNSKKQVPSAVTADDRLQLDVHNVPSFGGITVVLSPTPAQTGLRSSSRGQKGGLILENHWIRVRFSHVTGQLVSFYDKSRHKEMANLHGPRIGEMVYQLGSSIIPFQAKSWAHTTQRLNFGFRKEIVFSGQAPGCKQLRILYSLDTNSPTLHVTYLLNKEAVLQKEAVHIAFPFSIPNGKMRVDLPWSVVTPEEQQIAAANRNWMTTNRFVDISNQKYGVCVTSLDAPLIEVGGMTATMLGGGYQSKDWIHHLKPSQTFYSWALNNIWYTNYKAEQSGWLKFRYDVTVHGPYNGDQSFRDGVDQFEPLVVMPFTRNWTHSKLNSLLRLQALQNGKPIANQNRGAEVECLKPADSGKGYIVRLWGASGKTSEVKLIWRSKVKFYQSNLTESAGKPFPHGIVRVPGYGEVTILVLPSQK